MAAPIPDYSKVGLLLPMSGANNGTTFVDRAPVPSTITRSGVVTATDTAKYYGSSGKFSAGNYLQVPHSAPLLLSGDFTIQLWFLLTSLPAASTWPCFFAKDADNGTNKFILYTSNTALVSFKVNGVTEFSIGSYGTANVWHHAAVWRKDGVTRGAVNGVIAATSSAFSGITLGGTNSIWIGRQSVATSSYYFSGYMQDIMVATEALYGASNFTPPQRLIGDIQVETRDESGILVPRKYFVVPRSYPSVVKASGTTDAGGLATVTGLPACEYSVVSLDDGDEYNDLVLRRLAA